MLGASTIGGNAGRASGQSRAVAQAKRQDKVIALHVAGLSRAEIAARLCVSERTIFRDLVDVTDERVHVENIIEDCGIDAHDVWITLSKMHDADLADVLEPLHLSSCRQSGIDIPVGDTSGSAISTTDTAVDVVTPAVTFHGRPVVLANPLTETETAEGKCAGCNPRVGDVRPIREWPKIWRQGLAGEVTIEDMVERSKDGGEKSWDKTGGKKIKIKRESLLKIIELAARLKSVAALEQPAAPAIQITDNRVQIAWLGDGE